MSFYKNKTHTAPVAKIRSFFYSIAFICSLVIIFPVNAYAKEVQEESGLMGTDDTDGIVSSATVFSQNIYHKHTGNKNGGGCYTVKKSGTTTEEVPCKGTMVYWPDLGSTSCNKCGASYFGDQSGRECWHSETVTTPYTYYDLGCKKTTSTVLGTVSVAQDTTEWTKSLQLTASYTIDKAMGVADCPYIWNGAEAVADNTYEVTANGEYTLQLNADANANTKAAIVSISIRNIDVTAPVIHSHTLQSQEEWTKEGVTVTLLEVSDLQPEGNEGCGLHEFPYSYDLGQTWVKEDSYRYEENGIYNIWVRDALENVGTYEVKIANIDKTPPTMLGVEYDDTVNVRTMVLSVWANDIQADGSEGCGLHDTPYSFDGGTTWSADNTYQVDKNGKVIVSVRDKLENIAYKELDIMNIDCYGPSVSYEITPDSWTNQNVELHLHAEDKNADSTEGSGLEEDWYSLDGGKSWLKEETLVFETNQEITILARDKNDNRSSTDVSICRIDKELPWVSLRMEVVGKGEDTKVVLTAYGGDEQSGLAQDAYSWDKGTSYGNKQTREITENGLYQVRVRDKAGNWNSGKIEVDVFEKGEIKEPDTEEIVEETVEEIVTETVEETEIEVPDKTAKEENEEESVDLLQEPEMEETFEPVVVLSPQMKEESQVREITPLPEKDRGATEWFLLGLAIFLVVVLLLLLLLILLRVVVVFAEDESGKMRFIGFEWIHCKEERFEVRFFDLLLEQCVTTHFLLRPGILFVVFHKNEQISCLFPEDVCIILPIKKEMDFSLL